MKLTIEPTNELLHVEGVPCRRWTGHDDEGVPVEVMVRCLSPQTHDPAVSDRYQRDLKALPGAVMQPVIFNMRFLD